jgi:hypothetical protein
MSLILRRLQRAGYAPEEPAPAAAPLRPPRGSVEDVFRADDGVLPNARGGFDDDAEATLGSPGSDPCRRPGYAVAGVDGRADAARCRSQAAAARRDEGQVEDQGGRRRRHAGGRGEDQGEVEDRGGGQGKVSGTPALNMRLFHEILEVCPCVLLELCLCRLH